MLVYKHLCMGICAEVRAAQTWLTVSLSKPQPQYSSQFTSSQHWGLYRHIRPIPGFYMGARD